MAKGGVIEGAPELGVPKAELGRMSPAEYAQYTGASKAKISGLRLAERIYGSPEAVKNLRDKGISDADIISEAKRMQSMYVSAVGSGADPADINEAMRTLGIGNVTVPYVAETDVETDIVSTEETGQAGAKRGEKGAGRSIVSTTDELSDAEKRRLVEEAGQKASEKVKKEFADEWQPGGKQYEEWKQKYDKEKKEVKLTKEKTKVSVLPRTWKDEEPDEEPQVATEKPPVVKEKTEKEKSIELLKATRAKARKKIKSETSTAEELAMMKESTKYARAKKGEKWAELPETEKPKKKDIYEMPEVQVAGKKKPIKPTELSTDQQMRVKYLRDREVPDVQIEEQLGIKLPSRVWEEEDLDKAVDSIWALESSQGKDVKGLAAVDANPKVTATGEMQQNNAFYKDVTTRMGFPEYDRNNPEEAKEATRHYLKWIVENEGLSFEEAIRAYNVGVTGAKAGKGMVYFDKFDKQYKGV